MLTKTQEVSRTQISKEIGEHAYLNMSNTSALLKKIITCKAKGKNQLAVKAILKLP